MQTDQKLERERAALWKILDDRKETPMMTEVEGHLAAMEARLEQVMFREVRTLVCFTGHSF